ncbi:protein kinase domain protein [Ichthyophthirius multifiliis]|uniref:Protein kinase domain protein n=1 Tax=Ichthyophthirius multifiliis TaxID=5932 RepID=G0R1P7_ICHMU|nr:protein kinase domain protein [Ichthyophthirius multifiliis]EGR28607.1 protein kinase domain protein [Ichthyophthirius multifiliis]|eukprot:XP_004029843.1 protein kinase domain protein [Ichthyophthirius multifiliis]
MLFSQRYKVLKNLGDGVSSIVKLCQLKDKENEDFNKLFAVKIFKIKSVDDTLEIQREAQLLYVN